MREKENKDTDLIIRFITGESPAAEKKQVEERMQRDRAFREQLESYRKTWELAREGKDICGLDVDREWSILRRRITADERRIRHGAFNRLFRFALRIAAFFVIPVGLAVAAVFLIQESNTSRFVSDRETIVCHLPDHSIVTLNEHSEISFSRGLFQKKTVRLKGEAFFEVEASPRNPFTVRTRRITVKVTGTSFNVDSRTGSETHEVAVISGQVAVNLKNRPQGDIVLSPGKRATYHKSSKTITVDMEIDRNTLAWKTGILVFENDPLPYVAGILGKTFHTRIRIADESLRDCTVTARFQDQSLDSVLHVLEEILNIHVVKTGEAIEFREQ